MSEQHSPRLNLSYGWLRGEDWWGDPVSSNFMKLDMLVNTFVIGMTLTAPPALPTVGDMYIVPAGATGAWAGQATHLAIMSPTGWLFCTPTRGVRARLGDPASWIWFNGTVWIDEGESTDTGPAPLGTRYDVSMFIGYEAEPLEVVLALVIPEAMTLPNNAVGSLARCIATPTGIMRLPIRRNGIDIGTIAFSPSTIYGTITVTGNKLFATGDLLSVHVPDNGPVGFENYATTLRLILANNGT